MTAGRNGRLRHGWHKAALVALIAYALGGCATYVNGYRPETTATTPPAKQTEQQLTPAQREHQRILATYGGAYQDSRVEGLIGRVVDQLVAASKRPDLKYKITILSSP